MELSDVMNWLFGRSSSANVPQGKTYIAPPRSNYPTSEDVDFARKYDYSYGQPWAPEFEGKSGRLATDNYRGDPTKIPSATFGGPKYEAFLNKPSIKEVVPNMKDYYAKAALASEGSALAKLGFDPSKVTADIFKDPNKVSLLGKYDRDSDSIYANARDPSSIVHESIHRGMNKLHDTSFWKKEFNTFLDPNNNEMLVRYLMQSKMGNPEFPGYGKADTAQQKQAQFMYNGSSLAEERRKLADQLEAAAADYVAAKRPGGPR